MIAAVLRAKPKIFGLICSLLSNGLKNLDRVKAHKTSLPRMAGTFQWAVACLDDTYGAGEFTRAYEELSLALAAEVLNTSPVVEALIAEIEAAPEKITDTYEGWLRRLNARAGQAATTKEWPRTTRGMTDRTLAQ